MCTTFDVVKNLKDNQMKAIRLYKAIEWQLDTDQFCQAVLVEHTDNSYYFIIHAPAGTIIKKPYGN